MSLRLSCCLRFTILFFYNRGIVDKNKLQAIHKTLVTSFLIDKKKNEKGETERQAQNERMNDNDNSIEI